MCLHCLLNLQLCDLRGNVNTRLQKLADHDWNGAVFAAAGLERLSLTPALSKGEGADNDLLHVALNWMIPAPAQGAMVVHAMQNDEYSKNAVAELNHLETDICTYIERQFLRTLEGGCTAPIGALATFNDDEITFKGILLSIDGQQKIEVDKVVPIWFDKLLFR